MPAKRSNPKTMHRAGELRKEPTPAEAKLWSYLRGNRLNGVSFRRQHAIGNYIPDFVSIKHKLMIELDGSQHLEQKLYDNDRTQYLSRSDIAYFGSGTIKSKMKRMALCEQ